MAAPSKMQRHLIIGIIVLVAVQIGVAGIMGFKPSFKAGYFEESEVYNAKEDSDWADPERLKELEAILAPAPVLAWANLNPQGKLPRGLASTETVLSFADDQIKEEDGATIAGDQNPSQQGSSADDSKQAIINPPIPEQDPAVTSALDDQVARLELALNQTPQPGSSVQRQSTQRPPMLVAPIYVERLPDLAPLDADQRKKRFVAIMLPLIIRSNQELLDRRQQVQSLINQGDIKTLRQWAQLYRIKTQPDDVDALGELLLARVNTVPVSIALGQAVIESGWGTSRFAIQGNALFGQWAWSQNAGIRPIEASNSRAVVRSFANLFDSVRSYMHNLNTHHSYEDFRRARASQKNSDQVLINTLINYSEEREVYVDKLISIIAANGFERYNNAQLADH